MSVIKTANLPQKRVSLAVVGRCGRALEEYISSFKIKLLFAEENPDVDPAIKNHADINVLYLGDGEIVLDRTQQALFDSLSRRSFKVRYASKRVNGKYPGDCLLNTAIVGNRIFGRLDVADESVLNLEGAEKIAVRQGYAKCSVCVVNENALITDDPSIFNAAEKSAVHALLCKKGSVLLSGHGYGFIGGASALIEKNRLLFFGDITRHDDFEKISDFLKNEGCSFSYLKDYPLTDIGGMILLEEE